MSTDNTTLATIPQAPGDAPNLRVTIGDGVTKVEFLNVADSQQLSHSADVQQYPTAEEFQQEIAGHQRSIADIQAKLAEQRFDPRTGQLKGQQYEGEARKHLEMQLSNRLNALHYTNFNLSRAHQAAEARAAKAAQLAADNQPSNDTTSLAEQARRELLIAQTSADIGSDGKALGRVKATQLVDAELHRERVAARVRSQR